MASPDEIKNASANSLKLIDVRKKPDDQQIPGSIRYNGEALEQSNELPFTKSERIVLYCGSGNSSLRIARALRERGYSAEALEGGYAAWVEANLPLEPITELHDIR